jgi:hypothetical protein
MFIIEATRRVSRTSVARIRDAFLEYDHVVFKDVYIRAEDAYQVVRDGRTYVLAFTDPTIDYEPIERECGS